MNPYKGINAHFNSFLQNTFGTWATFHHDHITDLTRSLNAILPPNYYAVSEQSLQIQSVEPEKSPTTRPDVSIFQKGSPSAFNGERNISITPTLQVMADAVISEDEYLRAVEIYHVVDKSRIQPVVRIEVLSPTNKTTEYHGYLAMRRTTLKGGVFLLELDYLHETRSPFRAVLPDYTHHQEEAYPFYIATTDPHTDLMNFYCFHVNEQIPALEIPLAGGESVVLDFDAVYQQTADQDRRATLLVNYAEEPANFASYSPADQQQIRQVMKQI